VLALVDLLVDLLVVQQSELVVVVVEVVEFLWPRRLLLLDLELSSRRFVLLFRVVVFAFAAREALDRHGLLRQVVDDQHLVVAVEIVVEVEVLVVDRSFFI
jgi:hypothetical protein